MSYTKIIQSGSLIEVFTYEKAPVTRKQRTRPLFESYWSRLAAERRNSRKRRRLGANLHRTRQRFLRIVRANLHGKAAPSLLTLTMLDIVGIAEANKRFAAFRARYFAALGREVVYVCVPEFQKRGAVHFHVLVWGLTDDEIKNEKDTRRIQGLWGWGYVDILKTDGSAKLGGYLAKYMSKAMFDDRLAGKKAYSVSRNALRPLSVATSLAVDTFNQEWGLKGSVDNRLTRQHSFGTLWLGRCDYQRYEI